MMTQKEIQMEMDLAWKRIDDCIIAISDAAYEAKNNGKGNTYFVGESIFNLVTYADLTESEEDEEDEEELSIMMTDVIVRQLWHKLDKLREIPSWRDDPLLKELESTAVLQSKLIRENLKELEKLCNEEAQ